MLRTPAISLGSLRGLAATVGPLVAMLSTKMGPDGLILAFGSVGLD